jgi:cytidyltransferase-like protein
LFDAVTIGGIEKLCGKCASRENIPLINKEGDSKDISVPSTRERLLGISKDSSQEKNVESGISKEIEEKDLRQRVETNFSKSITPSVNLNDELIENFHWIIMRARRMKHLTQEQLAEEIREPLEAIKIIEQGRFPPRREILKKIQSSLGVIITKKPEIDGTREIVEDIEKLKTLSELNFKNVDELTISDLQEMKLEREGKRGKENPSENKRVVVATCGYFDPLHIGHIECFEKARALGDELIVILNNDYQTKLKKGKSFMSENERAKIIQSLKSVDKVFISIDMDSSVCKSLEFIKPDILAKGGDRFAREIPERQICEDLGIKIVDGLGEKIRSSSELIEKSKER